MTTTRTQLLTAIVNQDVAEIIMHMTEKLEKPKRDMDAVIKQIGKYKGWIGIPRLGLFLQQLYLKHELKGRDLGKLFKLNAVHYTTTFTPTHSPYWSGVELLSRQLRKTPLTVPYWRDYVYTPKKKKAEWAECATQNGIDVKRSWTVKRIKHELMKI